MRHQLVQRGEHAARLWIALNRHVLDAAVAFENLAGAPAVVHQVDVNNRLLLIKHATYGAVRLLRCVGTADEHVARRWTISIRAGNAVGNHDKVEVVSLEKVETVLGPELNL